MSFFSGPVVNIIRGSAIIPDGATTLTLVNGVDYTLVDTDDSKWFAVIANNHNTGMGRTNGGGTHRPDHTNVWITQSGADITLNRYNTRSGYDCRVEWEIIEYIAPSDFSSAYVVREKGVITQVGNSSIDQTTVTSLPGSVVDSDDVVVFITGQACDSSDTRRGHYGLFTAERGATDWSARRGYGGGTASLSYAVVEMTGEDWTVTTEGPFTVSAASDIQVLTTPLDNISNVISQYQNRFEESGDVNASDLGARLLLTSPNIIDVVTGSGSDLSSKFYYAYFLENENMVVDRYTGTQMPGGSEETVIDVPINPVADLTNASIWGASSNTTGGNRFPNGYFNFSLEDASTLRLRQSDNRETQAWAVEVAQFPEAPPFVLASATSVFSTAEIGAVLVEGEERVFAVGLESTAELGDVQESPGTGVDDLVILSGLQSILGLSTVSVLTQALWEDTVISQDPNWRPLDDRQIN